MRLGCYGSRGACQKVVYSSVRVHIRSFVRLSYWEDRFLASSLLHVQYSRPGIDGPARAVRPHRAALGRYDGRGAEARPSLQPPNITSIESRKWRKLNKMLSRPHSTSRSIKPKLPGELPGKLHVNQETAHFLHEDHCTCCSRSFYTRYSSNLARVFTLLASCDLLFVNIPLRTGSADIKMLIPGFPRVDGVHTFKTSWAAAHN